MSNFNNDDLDKSIKKVVNDINIEVPLSLRKSVLDSLDKLPQRKIKKNKGYKKVAGFIGLLLGGLLTFNSFMPVYAESIPIIGPTFKSINESIGFGGKYEENAKAVNLTKKYKDKTMTIKNIYYDGIELAIAYEIKSENGFDKKPVIFPIITRGIQDIDYKNENSKGEFADDNTYVGIASYVFQDKKMPEKIKINFRVNDIYGDWVGRYQKKFDFKLKLDSENMGKIKYKVDEEFEYDDSKIKVTDVDISPFNSILYYDIDTEILKYNDEDGNKRATEKHSLLFYAIDNNGMPLEFKEGSGIGYDMKDTRVKGSGSWRFDGASSDVKSITLIPAINAVDIDYNLGEANSGYISTVNKLNRDGNTIINHDNNQEYVVKSIDFKDDKTIVEVKVKKYIWSINNPEVYFEDEEGNEIEKEKTEFKGIDDGYDFTITLPKLDTNKEYFIRTYKNSVVLENEKITIDISNKEDNNK